MGNKSSNNNIKSTKVLPRFCPGYRGHPCGKRIKTSKGFCSSQCQGFAFEDLTQDLLRSLGFQIERNILLNGREADIIAYKWIGLVSVRFLVECKSSTSNKKRIIDATERLCAAVTTLRSSNKVEFGLLITDRKPSPEAASFGKSHFVIVCSIDDLLSKIIFSPKYENSLQQLILNSSRPFKSDAPFIQQLARTSSGEENYIFDMIRDWLELKENGIMAVIGRSGAGKSLLLLKVSNEYINTVQYTSSRPFPLFIRIRDILTSEKSIQSSFLEYWKERFGLEFPDFDSVDQLLRTKRAFLILDGLDELPHLESNAPFIFRFQDFVQEYMKFSQILVSSRNVIIIEHLTSHLRQHIKFIHLQPWTEQQILQYLSSPEQDIYSKVRNLIKDNSRIRELAKLPLFCRMLTTIFSRNKYSEVRQDVDTVPLLYDMFVEYLLEADRWKAHRKVDIMIKNLKNLAIKAFKKNEEFIYNEKYIEECRYSSFFEERNNNSFIFFHSSFLEYWIAQGLVDELSGKKINMLSIRRFSQLIPEFIAHKLVRKIDVISFLLNSVISSNSSVNTIINGVEILGEINQIDYNCITKMVFSNTITLEKLWERINSEKIGSIVQEALLNFLSILGSEEASIKLIKLYQRPEYDYLRESAFGIHYYGSINIFLEEHRKIVQNPATNFDRATCAYLLGEYGEKCDIKLLSSLLNSKENLIKTVAENAIQKINNRYNLK